MIVVSIGLKEVKVNDHMDIIDKVGMSSKEFNIKPFVEEASDSLKQDETRKRLLAFGRGAVTKLG